MIVCPVCEHSQAQGVECEVCGRPLARGAAAASPVPLVEGLEPTLHAPVATPSAARIPELEPTGQGTAAYVPETVPGLDPGRDAPVDVDVAPLPDVERIQSEIPGDGPTAVPAFVTCRYCRTPAMPGERICARCGMRLFVLDSAPAAEPVEASSVLCSCGTPVRGSLCPSCGARMR